MKFSNEDKEKILEMIAIDIRNGGKICKEIKIMIDKSIREYDDKKNVRLKIGK